MIEVNFKHMKSILILIASFSLLACNKLVEDNSGINNKNVKDTLFQEIIPAAECLKDYLPILDNKKVGLLINHTSMVEDKHLLDVLLENGIDIEVIFAPEHGFRGKADAGEKVNDTIDAKTNIPIISLYGKNRKPTDDSVSGLDIVIFDVQDVGVRFYTYISTMHYMMEACARNNILFLVLDRPNPNGDYIDGPILEEEFKSFVGMHPIPVVHGLTPGELARMINGERWLNDSLKCQLKVIPVKNYSHKMSYRLPVKPSPNLPNNLSIRLYPSLCFFEATEISIGRGTYFPFQVIGYPDSTFGSFSFTPASIEGMSKYPKQENKKCFGNDLRNESLNHKMILRYIIDYYRKWKSSEPFFSRSRWMDLLSGTDKLRKQIESGMSENAIKETWKAELEKYKNIRKKYLIYKDFE